MQQKRFRLSGTYLALIISIIVFSVLGPGFFSIDNAMSVVRQGAVLTLVSFGMTLAILMGSTDLSLGAVVGFAGIIAGKAMQLGLPLSLQILAALLAGTLSGLCNGLLISYVKLPPFVASFGMMGAAHGLALVLSDGRAIWGFPQGIRYLSNGVLLGLPFPLWMVGIACLILHLVLKRTSFGISIYAIGGNEHAASLSGINVPRNKTIAYTIGGLMAGLGGILMVSRMNSAQAIAGTGYEFDAIAATVVGGTSLKGGRGGAASTLIGALLISVLRNGLNMMGISVYIQIVFIGALIVLAFIVDSLREKMGYARSGVMT